MTEEEAQEEVENMRLRAKLLREENRKVTKRNEEEGD